MLREEHTVEIQNVQLREQEVKEHKIQGLLQSHDEVIAAKEREIQQLRIELEQTTHRMNEKEQALEELERKLDKMQLQTIGETRKYADVTDMKLTWRMGKPVPMGMYRSCNAVVDNSKVYFNTVGNEGIYCYNANTDFWTQLPDCPKEYSSLVVINHMLLSIGGLSSNDVYNLKGGKWVKEFPQHVIQQHQLVQSQYSL